MKLVSDNKPDRAVGVFATLLVVDGAPVELDAHVARLRASLRALYDAELPTHAPELVREHARGHALARLRIDLVPASEGQPPRAAAVARPIERTIVLPGWSGALALRAIAVEGWRGAHKWADRRLLERLDAEAAPAGALLVDPVAGVLETTRANVFCVGADGVLRTPPTDGRVLPGIARGRVLELAASAGVEVREEPFGIAALANAHEAFTTGSVRGIEPVRALDRSAIAGPGPVTTALATALERRWLGALGA